MAATNKTAKSNASKTTAKKTTVKKDSASEDLEARIAELEAKLVAGHNREDRMAALLDRLEAPATPAPEKKTETRTIRNLRGVPVHLRLKLGDREPYRVVLEPRGKAGDIASIPAKLVETTDFVNSYHAGLFEIITESEARDAHYGPTGFQPRQLASMYRSEDTVINTTKIESDGKNVGRPVDKPRVGAIGMNVVSMPGGDPQLTAQFQAMNTEAVAADQAQPGYVPSAQQAAVAADPESAKLTSKGVMPALPQVASVERGQGGQISW